jgi:hypothetical protein
MKALKQPTFSKTLFWDIDYDTLDVDKHASFVVERVLNRGSFEDFRAIVDYYGKENLKKIAMNVRYLGNKTLSFCGVFFHEPIENFRCYKLKQSNPSHWNY